LVRLKRGKKRFEIACYKNKVLEYRSGLETDLDNVLQVPTVFLNVSKGQVAAKEDLSKAFGKDVSQDEIILEILKKGELQVGDKERKEGLERLQKEVVDIVAGKLVDPKSKRVYTPGLIEKALDQLSSRAAQAKQEKEKDAAGASASAGGSGTETPKEGASGEDGASAAAAKKKDLPIWTGVVTTKSAKSQALDAMKALIAWQIIPVTRARMRLRVSCHVSILKQSAKPAAKKTDGGGADDEGGEKVKGTVKDRILGFIEEVESQGEVGGDWEVVGFVEPGAFKGLGDFIAGETKGKGRIEVLDMAVVHEGD
jgi:ribosome maturation protein SDO1